MTFSTWEIYQFLNFPSEKINLTFPRGYVKFFTFPPSYSLFTLGVRKNEEIFTLQVLKVIPNDEKLPMTLHSSLLNQKICGWEFYYFLCLSWFIFTLLSFSYKYFDICIYFQNFDHIFQPSLCVGWKILSKCLKYILMSKYL